MLVEVAYGWKGDVRGYTRGSTFVPFDKGNSDCRQIREAIDRGECEVRQPVMGPVTPAYDRHRNLTGYWCRFGFFIPADPANQVWQLLSEQIRNGTSHAVPEEPRESIEDVQTVIVLLLLQQRWPHLQGAFSGELKYKSNERSQSHAFRFTIRNLPVDAPDRRQLIMQAHGVPFNMPASDPLQFGTIEVEVPVQQLRRLFQGERPLIDSTFDEFFEDDLSQHLAAFGRSRQEGPDIAWLLSRSGSYLSHFAVAFGNHVIDAFKSEYGLQDPPMHCVTEFSSEGQPWIVGQSRNGRRFISLGQRRTRSCIGLNGVWPQESLGRYQNSTESPRFNFESALSRVLELVRLGFHAEALAPMNAFLELAVSWALTACMAASPDAPETIRRLGHRRRLQLISDLAQLPDVLFDDLFRDQLKTATSIYRHRNAYVHQLGLPNTVGRMTVLAARDIERLMHGFVDYFQRGLFFMRLQRVADGGREAQAFIATWLQQRSLQLPSEVAPGPGKQSV